MAYRADIEIAVRGAQELKRLQNAILSASDAVNSLNSNLSGVANLVPRSFDNLNRTVAQAARSFNAAALGTKEATDAAREYVRATDAANAGLRERAALLAKVQAAQRRTVPGDAGMGQQTPALPPQLIRTYEIGKNWVKFFKDAAGVAVDLQARALNTKASWNDFFATAAQAAVNVKANSLNTQKNWNDFFATAAQAAVNVKANSLNTKASWNTFFAEAAQLAEDLTEGIRQTEGKASAAARERLAADLEKRRAAAPEVPRRLISGVAAPQGMAPGNAPVSTAMQGPLAGPGAMGFPVALSLSKVEQAGLETAAKKQAILQRMAATRQDLVGLAGNLQRLDLNSVVAIADAARGQAKLVELAKEKADLAAAALKTSQAETKAAVTLAQQKEKTLAAQRKERSGMVQNALIGGAFPLLFGGGAGATLGGFAGGFIPGNPMMSIVTSALGTVVDQFATAATEMGASLRDPITNFEKLKEANLFASKTQEFYIQKLIETGRITEATGVIQARVASIIGNTGVQSLQELGAETAELGRLLGQLTLLMQAAIAGPLTALIAKMNEILGVKVSGDKAQNTINQLFEEGSKEAGKQLAATVNEITRKNAGNAPKIISEIDAAVAKAQKSLKPDTSKIKLDPAAQEQAIKAAEQQADIIKGAYRTGFQLQQQALDLQRQGTDLQRRVADDIFNKQQQIARLQIDNERQRQQIAIETVDLEYRRRISQEEGRVAEALAAEADLLKTRAQGEANIGNAKRLLELDIAKQQRDTENYVYQLGREIENIRRSTLNYEMQVADYRLDIERKVAAERRIENAGAASGSPTTSSAKPGATSKQQALVRAANMLGVDPVDLATIISFETGGTFSPSIKGGAGGNYQGLIQFGPNERKTYGASGQQSFEEQITGPVVKYFQSRFGGVGMKTQGADLLTLYRTVLGGNPKASLHAKDAFGTSPASGVERMKKGHRQKAMAFLGGNVTSSTASQLTTAESQVTARPAVPSVDAAGAAATLANLNAKDAAIRKEAVILQQKLNNLGAQAAEQRLLEVARGPIELKQREDAVKYAQAELNLADKTNSELAEQLALEAQSGVKRAIREEEDKQILANLDTAIEKDRVAKKDVTALLETRKNVAQAIEDGVLNTEEQIKLDKQLLTIAQQLRFEKEEAALQAQLGVTGTGLQAGFVGAAASAFESEMLKRGNTEQATRLAELTNQLTLAQVQAQGMESSVLAIGDAFGTAMTDGVASLINGTATAEQVFAEFLNTIAQALLKAAAQMIATYIAIAIAKAFAGMGSKGDAGMNSASALGTNPNVAAYAPLPPKEFAEGGFVTGPTSAVIGEGGESEYVIPASKMQSAMSRYSRGARGESVIAGSGVGTENGGGAAAAGPMVVDVRYSVERINDVEYVTASAFQAGMRQAAQQGAAQGEQRTLRRLQQSPGTRKRVGM